MGPLQVSLNSMGSPVNRSKTGANGPGVKYSLKISEVEINEAAKEARFAQMLIAEILAQVRFELEEVVRHKRIEYQKLGVL